MEFSLIKKQTRNNWLLKLFTDFCYIGKFVDFLSISIFRLFNSYKYKLKVFS